MCEPMPILRDSDRNALPPDCSACPGRGECYPELATATDLEREFDDLDGPAGEERIGLSPLAYEPVEAIPESAVLTAPEGMSHQRFRFEARRTTEEGAHGAMLRRPAALGSGCHRPAKSPPT